MKAYTDIEQSKKLAEILPLESADMHYATWTILDNEFIVSPNQGSTIESLQEDYGNQIIPCWSLAALLNILPKSLVYTPNPTLDAYCCKNIMHDLETYGNNPVDVCYEMIIKLNELKNDVIMERKEAIEVIKKNWPDSSFTMLREALETIIPELKESEDERIRKALIDYFNRYKEQEECGIKTFFGIPTDNILAWLEKQSTPQVRTGLEWLNTIDDACDKRYAEEYAHGEYCHEQSFKWGFQEGVDWLEKQSESTDINPSEFDLRLNKLLKQFETLPKEELASSLSFYLNVVQNDGTYKADEKKGEQKSAEWSEEDEAGFGDAMWAIEQARTIAKDENDMGNLWYAERWLKSLKPQSHWKPTEDQVKALHDLNLTGNISYVGQGQVLIELYEQLKKL